MMKRRSLLAILLALILVLLLMPAASAETVCTVVISYNFGIESITFSTTAYQSNATIDTSAPNKYSISFDHTIPDDAELTLSYTLNNPNLSHYTDAAVLEKAPNTVTNDVANMEITFKLSDLAATNEWDLRGYKNFTITFNNNKPTDAPGNVSIENAWQDGSYTSLQTLNFSDTKPSLEGYLFLGWKRDGSDDTLFNSDFELDPTNLPSSFGFTAQWVKSYTIRYADSDHLLDGVSGTTVNGVFMNNAPSPVTVQLAVGSDHSILSNVPTLTVPSGATTVFQYWQDEENNRYTFGDEIENLQQDYVLTPVFLTKRTVTYNDEGTETLHTTDNLFAGDTITLKGPMSLLPSGWSFEGWLCSADNQIYATGASYTIPAQNVTMTAQYKKPVTITYDVDNVPVSNAGNYPQDTSKKTGDSFALPAAPTPNDTAISFAGWKLSWDDSRLYAAGAQVTLPADTDAKTITAQYHAAISFAPGGTRVTGMPTDGLSHDPNSAATTLTLPAAAPTRSGYTFKGWRYSLDNKTYAAGAQIPAPTLAQLTSGVPTLTATWAVRYYPDYDEKPSTGGSSTGNTGTVTYYYTIDASCSSGGSILPYGAATVRRGNSLTVTWAPRAGYAIDGVYIDGVRNNSFGNSYTFRDVTASHSVYVRFVRQADSTGGYTSPATDDSAPGAAPTAALALLALLALTFAAKRAKA